MASPVLAATVTSASPLTVTVDGASTAAAAVRLAAYTPAAGDRVAVMPYGKSQLLILGKVV